MNKLITFMMIILFLFLFLILKTIKQRENYGIVITNNKTSTYQYNDIY